MTLKGNWEKIVAVTGGAGFIGSNLLLYLVPKYPQYLFVNIDCLTYAANLSSLSQVENADNSQFEKISVADFEKLSACFEKYNFDAVIHLAAESHVDRSIIGPSDFVTTNLNGTFHLLELVRSRFESGTPVRFVHVSTDEVYGSLGDDDPVFSEGAPYRPNSPYSATKAGGDHLVGAYIRTYGIDAIITHSSNNFGPRQFPEKLIPLVINNILNRQEIPVYGDGQNIRSWLYVEDHCRALDTVLRGGQKGATYLIDAGNEMRNLDLVRLLCRKVDEKVGIAGSERLITFVEDRAGHDYRYGLDSSRIRTELGWRPQYEFEKALDETIQWYLEHQDWLNACISGEYMKYYKMNYKRKLSQS